MGGGGGAGGEQVRQKVIYAFIYALAKAGSPKSNFSTDNHKTVNHD